MGEEIESNLTRLANETQLWEQERKNSSNKNMTVENDPMSMSMSFASKYKRKWLISAFEAGDIVNHHPDTVSLLS